MRSTPQNKQRLCIAEYNFEKAKTEAQETWSDRLVSEFNTTNNAKDFWNTFKKMTRKTEDKSVLPLMGDNNIPVFDSRNKTEMLRGIFYGGKHLKHDSFDKDFCEKINEEYATINEKLAEDENDVSYKEGFGREITTKDVESVIFRLKTGTAPGPDGHYSEFFKNAGENFINALEVMMNIGWSTIRMEDCHSKVPEETREIHLLLHLIIQTY
jgi:hypothetical protein